MLQYKVNCKNLFMRRGPDKKSGAVKLLKEGDIVQGSAEVVNGWIRAEFQGVSGYLPYHCIEVSDSPQYDEDNIGVALERAFSNVYAALDELKEIVKLL